MRGHLCRLCEAADVPLFLPACPRCFKPIPHSMGARLVRCWKHRVAYPTDFQEALAAVLQWRRDRQERRPDAAE